jgi:hypothetical protein
MDKKQQPPPRPAVQWGLFQWGRLWSTHSTKAEAIKEALAASGEPWRKTREYFHIQRVRVLPTDRSVCRT